MVEKTITKMNFWYGLIGHGETINVWACISKDLIANFNFPAPNSAKIIAWKAGTKVEFWNFEF